MERKAGGHEEDRMTRKKKKKRSSTSWIIFHHMSCLFCMNSAFSWHSKLRIRRCHCSDPGCCCVVGSWELLHNTDVAPPPKKKKENQNIHIHELMSRANQLKYLQQNTFPIKSIPINGKEKFEGLLSYTIREKRDIQRV